MSQIADLLSRQLGTKVIDNTGLTGSYDCFAQVDRRRKPAVRACPRKASRPSCTVLRVGLGYGNSGAAWA